MDATISSAISLGTAALHYLNELLDSRETAKCWYGKDHYKDFTKIPFRLRSIFKCKPESSRKIIKVFTIRGGNWEQAIEECVYNHQLWQKYSLRTDGDCSWLPIYDAVSQKQKDSYLDDAKLSAGFVAAAKSLPAARLDAWGLVVLALANGAKPQVKHSSNGGFYAELSGRDFVVTIWQQDISGALIGHIEPRNQALERLTTMTSPEWQNLLWHGHSFSQHHHIFGWPLDEIPIEEPPKNLTTSHHDGELKTLVIDSEWTKILQEKLRDALYKCYDSWDAVQQELVQKNCSSEDEEKKKKIETTKEHLKSFKLILADEVDATETSLVLELREKDILHYAKNQLDYARRLNNNRWKENQQMDEGSHSENSRTEADHSEAGYQKENDQEKCENKGRQRDKIQELLQRQKVVVALTRLLVLPQKIDWVLSTRATGTTILVV